MGTVTSADGTSIRFDVIGAGQPLIVVDGATAHRAVANWNTELGEQLADEFRIYTYDRRGRGESGDTAPYAMQREIEDLAALIEEAGGSATVLGISSGGVLSLDAATAGLPISRLALFEPPFVVDGTRPPLPSDYVEQLDAFVAQGRRGDAVELFMTAAAGVPKEFVAGMRQSPFWSGLEDIAHTIAYDGRFMGTTMSGAPLPTDRWALTVPTLVMHGDRTPPSLMSGPRALVELLPTATLRVVDGADHSFEAKSLAQALREFASN